VTPPDTEEPGESKSGLIHDHRGAYFEKSTNLIGNRGQVSHAELLFCALDFLQNLHHLQVGEIRERGVDPVLEQRV